MKKLALALILLGALALPGQADCLFNCGNNPPCQNDMGCLGPCVCSEGQCVPN